MVNITYSQLVEFINDPTSIIKLYEKESSSTITFSYHVNGNINLSIGIHTTFHSRPYGIINHINIWEDQYNLRRRKHFAYHTHWGSFVFEPKGYYQRIDIDIIRNQLMDMFYSLCNPGKNVKRVQMN